MLAYQWTNRFNSWDVEFHGIETFSYGKYGILKLLQVFYIHGSMYRDQI